MKRLFYVLAFFFLALNVSAQESNSEENSTGWKVKAGLMFNPQGTISLEEPDFGFEALYPLQFIMPIVKGKSQIIPFYSVTDNSIGSYVVHSFGTFDIYLIGDKSVNSRESYLGIGTDIFIRHGEEESIFIEFGNAMNPETTWDPWFSIGLSLTFAKVIRF